MADGFAFGGGELGKHNAEHVHLDTGGDKRDDAHIRCASLVPLTSAVAIEVGSSDSRQKEPFEHRTFNAYSYSIHN